METKPLTYTDGEAVEMFDQVEFGNAFTDDIYEGVVTAIRPRARRVRIRFKDHNSLVMKTWAPKVRSAEVEIERVTMLRRDQ